ncbi:unnamed protein product [Pseudo-nitzschia multistriata]|uniref:Uncharacterized protein n=1 Tax=Pseudo-nitzschia multistriata TaxID=183589 RepID=A0A448Z7Q9_9STRA|nr:unnamed protein product [Pseudo-nitzschia multistriata]
MKPITILLGNFTKRKEATNSVEIPFPESIGRSNLTLDAKCDEKKVLSIEINEGMANSHETIMVTDGARCTVEVNNPDHETTVDLTIFQGYGADNDPKILQINSGVDEVSSFSAIPTCMFEQLSIHDNTNTTNFYSGSSQVLEAIEWMIEDSTVYSECHTPNFVERFALSVLNYAAPTKSSDNGLWIDKNAPWEWDEVEYINGSLSALDLSEASLEGTISTYIGLLTSLSRISMSDNGLTGKLPSEIGLISSLESLEMGNNALSGSLPSEIGKLTLLTRLSLGKYAEIFVQVVGYRNMLPFTWPLIVDAKFSSPCEILGT